MEKQIYSGYIKGNSKKCYGGILGIEYVYNYRRDMMWI